MTRAFPRADTARSMAAAACPAAASPASCGLAWTLTSTPSTTVCWSLCFLILLPKPLSVATTRGVKHERRDRRASAGRPRRSHSPFWWTDHRRRAVPASTRPVAASGHDRPPSKRIRRSRRQRARPQPVGDPRTGPQRGQLWRDRILPDGRDCFRGSDNACARRYRRGAQRGHVDEARRAGGACRRAVPVFRGWPARRARPDTAQGTQHRRVRTLAGRR